MKCKRCESSHFLPQMVKWKEKSTEIGRRAAGATALNPNEWGKESLVRFNSQRMGKGSGKRLCTGSQRSGLPAWCCRCLLLPRTRVLASLLACHLSHKGFENHPFYLFIQLSHKTTGQSSQGHTLLSHTLPFTQKVQGQPQPRASLASVCYAVSLTAKPPLACLPST